MIVNKGTVLKIKHDRKGIITVIALRSFDTVNETFYPVATAEAVNGVKTVKKWLPGDKIPCKKTLCTIMEVIPQN